MTFYFTLDSDAEFIEQDAEILTADDEKDAERIIMGCFNPDQWSFKGWLPGIFSDAWFKTYVSPDDESFDDAILPFVRDQMSVQHPGTHPGGRCWWITPQTVEVYTPVVCPKPV